MFAVQPITPITAIVYTIAFIFMSQCVGGGVGALLSFLTKAPQKKDLIQTFIYNMALFIAAAPLLGLLLSIPKFFTTQGVFLISTFLGIMYICMKDRDMRAIVHGRFHVTVRINKKHVPYCVSFLLVFMISLTIRFLPLVDEYVYPAHDAYQYAFLTTLVIENKAHPFNLGYLDRYATSMTPFPYSLGFPAVNSFLVLTSGMSVPISTALLSQVGSALFALGVFYLSRDFFDKRTAIISALIAALVSPWPLSMFNWGGNSEYFLFFLGPIIFTEVATMLKSSDKRYIPSSALLLAGSTLMNVHLFFYVFPMILLMILYYTIKYKSTKSVKHGGAFFLLCLIFISYPAYRFLVEQFLLNIEQFGLYRAVTSTVGLRHGDIPSIWRNVFIFGWPQIAFNDEWINHFFLSPSYPIEVNPLIKYVFWLPTMLLPCFLLNKKYRKHLLGVVILAGWLLTLFLLNENSPVGLYFLPIWGLSHVTPYRFGNYIFVPLTVLLSTSISFSLHEFLHLISQRKSWLKNKISVSHRKLLVKVSSKLASALLILAVMTFTLFTCIYSGYSYFSMNHRNLYKWKKSNIPVTDADIAAFRWIDSNTPKDSVFFITEWDAGFWIYQFTGRQAVPLFLLMSGIKPNTQMRNLSNMVFHSPTRYELPVLLSEHKISYVYVGAKRIFIGNLLPPNLEAIQNSPFFSPVYEKDCVHIYEVILPLNMTRLEKGLYKVRTELGEFVCASSLEDVIVSSNDLHDLEDDSFALWHNGDNVTLRGPSMFNFVVERRVDHWRTVEINKTITVAYGDTWTYELKEWDTQAGFPGNWDAYFRVIGLCMPIPKEGLHAET